MTTRVFVHRISDSDEIEYVNDEWRSFADENGATGLGGQVIGRPLWPHITGLESQHIIQLLVERVRTRRDPVKLSFRRDSPTIRRFMDQEIFLLDRNRVEFRGWVVREEPRESVDVRYLATGESDSLAVMCAWCKRVRTPRGWVEVEEAIRSLGFFAQERPLGVSHGVCEPCYEAVA